MKNLLLAAMVFLTSCMPATRPEPPTRALPADLELPPMRTFGEATPPATPTRANAEIAQDFLDLTFTMESGRTVPVMTRFDGPITVRVLGEAPATLGPDLRALLGRLQTEAGLDIFMTGAPQANITIQVVPSRELSEAVPNAACFVVPRVSSWDEFRVARRSTQIDWTTLTIRDRAAIFIPTGVAPQEIRDCLHEELAQALGPLNDLYRLPDSVFNDDNFHTVLTSFDMLILRAYYSDDLANGMSRDTVARALPGLLARLNPAGQSLAVTQRAPTSEAWVTALETALDAGNGERVRRNAAEQAAQLSSGDDWAGVRRGFALYAFGRLQIQVSPDTALEAFRDAAMEFQSTPQTALHGAHVAVQMAAFALSSGDGENTLLITDTAIPLAARNQNAALLSILLMFRAEALELTGRVSEAREVRLDSLAWARYGFGSEEIVAARLSEIAALNPQTRS